MKTKKLFASLLTLSLALTLSACTNDSKSQQANTLNEKTSENKIPSEEVNSQIEAILSDLEASNVSNDDLKASIIEENQESKKITLKEGWNTVKDTKLVQGMTLKEANDWLYDLYDLGNIEGIEDAYYIIIKVNNHYYSSNMPEAVRDEIYKTKKIKFDDADYEIRSNETLKVYSSHDIEREEVSKTTWEKDGNDISYNEGDVYIKNGKLILSGENGGIRIDSLKLEEESDARIYNTGSDNNEENMNTDEEYTDDDILEDGDTRYLCIDVDGSLFASDIACDMITADDGVVIYNMPTVDSTLTE